MKQKFKFKILDFNGKIKHIVKEFDCPDFEVIPGKLYKNILLPETSIESQLMDWLDGQDKKQFMGENDIEIIFDYWVYKKKKGKKLTINLTMYDYLKTFDLDDKLLLDLLAIYKEIYDKIKSKPINEQILLLFSHAKIAYISSTNAYNNIINNYNKGDKTTIVNEIGEGNKFLTK